MTARTSTGAGIVLAAALALSGCSGDEAKPPASGSSSSSSSSPGSSTGNSSSPAADLKDRSSELLAYQAPQPAITTTGTRWGRSSGAMTIKIISLEASPTTTVLTYALTASKPANVLGTGEGYWPAYPALVDPAGKKIYQVTTFDTQSTDALRARRHGNYNPGNLPAPPGSEVTVQYPPLPSTVTSVRFRLPTFKEVSVPVTR